MAKLKSKGKGGSQMPKAATIAKRSKPKGGKTVSPHMNVKGGWKKMPKTKAAKSSYVAKGGNPNQVSRSRLDKFSGIAHAHTSVASPIKAFPINDRGKARSAKHASDPKVMAAYR